MHAPLEQPGSTTALDRYEPEGLGVTKAEVTQPGAAALAARVEAEVKARTFVALQRPRDVEKFRRRLLDSCDSQRFAEAAWYKKPIGGSHVYGFSIRFAEECARFYGNLDVSSDVISEDDERRIVQCCVVDLEVNLPWRIGIVVPKTVERRNVRSGDEVIRVRQNSSGITVHVVKATDDQVFTTQMALTAKAVRNLILNHVPSDIKEEAEERIQKTLASEVDKDPVKFRRTLVDAFFRLGVTSEQLVEFLGKGMDDANSAELFELRSLGAAIKAGEGTWADVMEARKKRTEPMEASPTKGADKLRAVTGTAKKAPEVVVPDRITALIKKEQRRVVLTDEEAEDLRQWRTDHPEA